MFRESRKKIVLAIMSILTLVWAATLGLIYIFSYYEISSTNQTMLKEYANRYVVDKPFEWNDIRKPVPDKRYHFNENQLKLTTFYSVVFTEDMQLKELRNDPNAVYSEEELESFARNILKSGKTTGRYNDLTYYWTNKQGGILVVFMDNTILSESMHTLFRYTLYFGVIVIIALYFVAVYLARRIVAPLEDSYRKQKQFISDAGHELKTPISIINANADLLAMELKDNQWLSNIRYENERMRQLVVQLLDLARAENATPQLEQLDLSRLIEGELLVFDSVTYEHGLTINSDIKSCILIKGNSNQLKQLVSVLLDNAIEHGSGGNEIKVSLTREKNHARLSVVNYGDEIPIQHRENLFERFYRVDESRSGEGRHLGLGLAIAKAVTELHRGKIEVKCYSGQVEFVVILPCL